MKSNYYIKIGSLIISVVILLSVFFNAFINVMANDTNAKAVFTYGDYDGVESAVGANPDDIEVLSDKFTLPENANAMNLYWQNGKKTFKAGTAVSVSDLEKDNNGNYPFTAFFGNVSLDFDEIDTEPFTFTTNNGKSSQVGTLFEQLTKNQWWGIPSGYANDGTTNTALGASNYSVIKRTESGETGNYLFLKKWATSNTYFNAALFTHSPIDTTDPNSHNSNATGSIDYSYVYFTPGIEYTLTFDYKLDTTGGGEPPYNASIAFGMDTTALNSNCAQKTIEYADGLVSRTNVDLGTESGKWKKASVTVKAPDDYTGNGVTSARVGISLKVKTGSGCYIDNVKLQAGGTKVYFKYGEANGVSEAIGDDLLTFADDDGNFTVPGNDSAKNLFWQHGDTLYASGTNLNIKDFDDDLTFKAYFGGATQDFENICTNDITFPTTAGKTNKNLFVELTRNPGYWKVPKGLSNTQVGSNYGTALGHDRAGIASGAGKSGKGLQFLIDKNYTATKYHNAVLFSHSPASFTTNDTINYSYVYFTPSEKYTMEFDYKTSAPVDVAVAFGVSTEWSNDKSGSLSVNSASFENAGNHITLAATNNEWKHASITVTAPDSYTGNGVTSARVGIAVKDSEIYDGTNQRYDYFDNISFYPTTMSCDTAKINYGSETGDEDSRTVSYFKSKSPLKSNASVILPGTDSITAALRSGTNENGLWTSSFGSISNLIGWRLNGTDKVYAPQDSVPVDDLPDNTTFSAVYGDATVDFESVDESFSIFNSNKLTYGSNKSKIKTEDGNTFVRFESQAGMTEREQNNIFLFTEKNKFAGYNVNSMYKVTFKYRRVDNADKEARINFSFGTVPFDWRAQNRKISGSEICVTEKNMQEFETVTAVVTSPNSHVFQKSNENYYSRTMAVTVELSEGVVIDIDDIEIKAVGLEGDSFGTATFDYGDSNKAGDTKTMRFAESIIMPGQQTPVASIRRGVNEKGVAWSSSYGKVANQNAWYCTDNKKYYELGQKVNSAEFGKKPHFIAVYENGKVDFNNIPDDFSFVVSGKTSCSSSLAKLKGDTNKYVNITGTESQKNSAIQVSLFTAPDNFLAYNAGKTYKVTFKYRRTDNNDVKSSLYFGFGSVLYDWRAASNCVNRITVAETKKGMTEFETVTAYVTAPDTYEYSTGGSNPQYFYSRTMSVGATFSNGVSIDFDDINVEAIGRDEVAMTFYVPDFKKQTVVIGKVGNKISIPNVELDRNTVIEGWYTDSKFTKPFKLAVFPETGITVYGKTADAQVRYYGFEDYPWDSSINSKNSYAREDNHIIVKGFSSDGDGYSLKIDNTCEGANSEQQGVALPIKIKPNTKYLISYDFYYEKIGDTSSTLSDVWFNTTVSGSVWVGHKQNITNTDTYVPASLEEGKWMTGYVYGTTTEFTWSNSLAIFNRVPVGSVRYIDNIVVTEIPDGYSVAMFKLGSFQSPKPIIAKTNSVIKMPSAKLDSKFAFLNWVLNSEDYTDTTYRLEADTVFEAKTTVKTFSEDFEVTSYGDRGINSFGMDLDWEIYDSSGKSSANVKSGRYSLHKIGKDLRNSAYCFHHNAEITKYLMAIGRVYTVSFWAKVENPVHKLGSIDIASCISLANPWDFTSDEFNVAAIADIADGEWHKLTYTFMASGEYLSIIVPGNLSIYIDDLTVEYTPEAERSQNCKFEEYIPAFLTEDGKYVKPDTKVDGLDKFLLVKRTVEAVSEETNNSKIILPVVIVSAIVLLGGITLAVILICKKKKRG